MLLDFGYLMSAVLAKLKNNRQEIDKNVWKMLIAGLIGTVVYILAFAILVFWLLNR